MLLLMIDIWIFKPNKKIGRVMKRGMQKLKPKYDIISIIRNQQLIIGQLKEIGQHFHHKIESKVEIDEIDLDISSEDEIKAVITQDIRAKINEKIDIETI